MTNPITPSTLQKQPQTISVANALEEIRTSLIKDQKVMQDCIELAKRELSFEQFLLGLIPLSITYERRRIDAANAITILIRAGVQFIGKDLRGIRIPGADLSYGVFDSANLENADLNGTTLTNVWLRKSNLKGAQMENVKFGERSYSQQENPVEHSLYSPDGETYAMVFKDGTINVYATSDWTNKCSLMGEPLYGEVRAFIYSNDGKKLISVNNNGMRIWDIVTNHCSFISTERTDDKIWGCRSLRSGAQNILFANEICITLWNLQTNEKIRTFGEGPDPIEFFIESRMGDQFATLDSKQNLKIWKVNDNTCLILERDKENILELNYSPDGSRLATVTENGSLQIWDTTEGKCIAKTEMRRDVSNWQHSSIEFLPNNRQIAFTLTSSITWLWDWNSSSPFIKLKGHVHYIKSIACSPNGQQIATGSYDHTVRIWDVTTGQCIRTLSGHQSPVSQLMYSPKGQQLVSRDDDKRVRVWDLDKYLPQRTVNGHTGGIVKIACSPNGKLFASASHDWSVRIWDANDGECVHILQGGNGFYDIKFAPNGQQVATGDSDGTIQVWNTSDGKYEHTFTGNTKGEITYLSDSLIASVDDKGMLIWSTEKKDYIFPSIESNSHLIEKETIKESLKKVRILARSPNNPNNQLATVDHKSSTVQLWDIATQADQLSVSYTLEHSYYVKQVVYLSDNHIASVGGSAVRLWSTKTGKSTHTLEHPDKNVFKIVHSPNGEHIISIDSDKVTRLWNVGTGECSHIRQDTVTWSAAAFSLDSQLIATAASGLKIWDVASGECLATVEALGGRVYSLAWLADADKERGDHNHYLVIGHSDGSITTWKVHHTNSQIQMNLHFNSMHTISTFEEADISSVKISPENLRFLEQHGAIKSLIAPNTLPLA